MAHDQIKELFYSNGVDFFGPVSIEEFSKNRYYKSTLVWYEGLSGWISIEDCRALRHLIGTLSTPMLNSAMEQTSSDFTFSSPKGVNGHTANSKRTIAILSIATIAALILAYFFNRPVGQKFQNPILKAAAELDSATIRENNIIKEAHLKAEMKTYRMNWEKFILTTPNDFRRREIGGIKDLKVILKNNSPYPLDSASVKVEYIKANGDTYLAETLQFYNIPPNGIRELYAPDSKRGVKVNCSIIAVTSNAMKLCFDKKDKHLAGIAGEEPFICE